MKEIVCRPVGCVVVSLSPAGNLIMSHPARGKSKLIDQLLGEHVRKNPRESQLLNYVYYFILFFFPPHLTVPLLLLLCACVRACEKET